MDISIQHIPLHIMYYGFQFNIYRIMETSCMKTSTYQLIWITKTFFLHILSHFGYEDFGSIRQSILREGDQ